jgi:protein O-GlcNAc transferase
MSAANTTFQKAVGALNQRNLAEAERLFKEVLRSEPAHAPALNLLTAVLMSTERFAEAEPFITRAISLGRNSDVSHYNYGIILKRLNRPAEALQQFNKALDLNSAAPETWNNRATIFNDLRQYQEAIFDFDQALSLKPDYAEALANKGKSLMGLNRHGEALAAYDKSLAFNPDLIEAWLGRGAALSGVKRFEEAFAAYNKALALKPALAEAWLGRGGSAAELRRFDEALTAYDKALAFKPDMAEAWLGRGIVLAELKRFEEALTAYDKALAFKSDLAETWLHYGDTFAKLKQYKNAFAAFDRALNLRPDLKYAEGARLHARMHLCDWDGIEADIVHLLSAVKDQKLATVPFCLLSIPATPADQLQCAKTFVAEQGLFSALWRGEIYAHDRIRVAYLSADFRNHAVARVIAGLFEHHDRSRFEITGIAIGPTDGSPLRRRLEAAFEHFIDANGQTEVDIANLIRSREVDVAVDLMGHTQDSELGILGRRPAPIQVHYLGYAGTLGTNYIDYILADATVAPEEHRGFYSEQVVWLPDSYLVSDNRRAIAPRTPTRAECGLPEDAFVFCSFNNSYKIGSKMFDLWMRLLRSTPRGVLWLSQTDETATANLRREAERHGVSPQRLIFAPKVEHDSDHLARQRQADLFLDTLPYNGHTTASDALWAGLPVLTCLGGTFAGRVAASLLRAVGLPELVTRSLQDYEALALRLAREPSLLASIKAKLVHNRDTHPLFNTARFTRHIEAAYTAMWQRFQSRLPPQAFAVEPIG